MVLFNSVVKLPGGGPLLAYDFAVAKLAAEGERPSLLKRPGGRRPSVDCVPVLGPVGRGVGVI